MFLSPNERSETMKQTKKWRAFLVVSTILSMSLVGCNKAQNKEQEEAQTAPVVTAEVPGESIYNNAYEEYNNLTDLGVIINSPKEEDLSRLNTLDEYEYDKNANENMLVIPKYNGTKITISSVEYTGERYITKDVLYSIDSTPEGYGLLLKANRPEGIAQIAIYVTYKEKTVEYIVETTNGKDGNTENEYLKVEADDSQPKDGDMIAPEADASTYLQGLNCFSHYEIDMDKDGNNESIEVYSQGSIDNNGRYLLDDGQEWALILRKGEEIYPLFERSYIQLGGLEYTIYEDYDDYERMHIIVAYNTGTAMIYYDCTYDEESGYIRRESVYEASNISKLQEWSYKNCD